MKNIPKPLAKNVLILLALTAAASASDVVTQRKTFGAGMTALIMSNAKMDDMKMLNLWMTLVY